MNDTDKDDKLHMALWMIVDSTGYPSVEVDFDKLKTFITQRCSQARIDENTRWQKLVLDRTQLHSSSPYINVIEYEQRKERLKAYWECK